MQTIRIVQAVVLMMIVALAASCAASKAYSSKLFAPRSADTSGNQAIAIRFLELDAFEADQQGADWVSTDIITGRDSSDRTTVLDQFVKTLAVKKDTTITPATKTPAVPVVTVPVAKTVKPGEVRTKRTREEE